MLKNAFTFRGTTVKSKVMDSIGWPSSNWSPVAFSLILNACTLSDAVVKFCVCMVNRYLLQYLS